MILLLGLTLAGCASEPVVLPDWEIASRIPSEVADPLPLPRLCEIPWDAVACWQRLDEYDIIAHGNTDIAVSNTAALRKTEAGYDAVIEAGKMQQQLSQIRQELLEQERKAHFWDNVGHRAFIALGVIAIIIVEGSNGN